MRKNYIRAVLACAAMLAFSPPAFADPLDQIMCPLEALGEEDAQALSVTLSNIDGAASDQDVLKLQTAVNSCSAQHGWKADDSKRALKMNLSMLSALGLDERLSSAGLDVVPYEALLEQTSAAELRALIDQPEGNAILNSAMDRLNSDQGDKSTPDMAGNLAAYLVHIAQVQLLTMEAMDLTE